MAGDRSGCKSKQGGGTEQYQSAAIITVLLDVHTPTAPAEFVCIYNIRKIRCKHPLDNLFPYWF